MSFPTRLGAIVTHNSILRQLFRQAATYQHISLQVRNLLEEPLRSHVRLGAIRDGTLTLTTDSSAWAAKLRYQVPNLHRELSTIPELSEIQTIRVKVAILPAEGNPSQSRKALPMSRPTADGLQRQAEALDVDDVALKGALLRLAKRYRE